VEAGLKAAHRSQFQRKEVEKKRPVSLRGKRNHLAALLAQSLIEYPLQVGRLAAQTGAVVHDLAVNLPSGEIDETHSIWLPVSNLAGARSR